MLAFIRFVRGSATLLQSRTAYLKSQLNVTIFSNCTIFRLRFSVKFRVIPYTVFFLKQNKSRDHLEDRLHRLLQLKRRLATCINFPCSCFEPSLAIVSSSTERNYEWLQVVIIVKELVTLFH